MTVAVDYRVAAPPFDAAGRFGRVARYAWGRDYHDVVIPRLRALGAALLDVVDGATRSAVACDHSPLLERAAAARAGLGFVGKNTCLLLPRRGSWVFLGEILLDAELDPTPPAPQDHCGTCVRCLDDCPTDAFPAPYVLDARRCISYLTIEHRGVVPARPAAAPRARGSSAATSARRSARSIVSRRRPTGRSSDRTRASDRASTSPTRSSFATTTRFARASRARRCFDPGAAGCCATPPSPPRNVGATAAVPALARLRRGRRGAARARPRALGARSARRADAGARLAERALAADADPDVRDEARALLADPS